ncbi:CLC_0170 family protein [Paenibacillus sp. PAMC21692]|uniref:CLC_0170 family protein n=1 Tax=Paenibacillus sp. PAMC21692 TaxID=2762320 RepID=UPI0037C774D1
MAMDGYFTSYVNYAIPLWLVSGLLILSLDIKYFELAKKNKEKKVSRFLGWFNIVLACLLFVGNWILKSWG